MPVITLHDQQFALEPGETRLGGGASVDLSVTDDAAAGVQAVVSVAGQDRVAIRRADENAVVRINGVLLGVEPTPLMHGDRIEIAGRELLYADDRKGGATQFMSSSDAMAAAQKRAGTSRPTAATGGRLVSLVDGKEYAISAHGASIGRDVACDVVVPDGQVSRRHAEIMPTDAGYEVHDHSTNGVFVNGTRVQGSQLLARADVIRVGGEEFRFYADIPSASHGTPAGAPAADPGTVLSAPAQPSGSAPPLQLQDRPALRATGAMPSLPKTRPAVTPTPPSIPTTPAAARSRAWIWPLMIIVAAAIIAALYLRYR